MSLTRTVPAAVPSLFHSSRPWVPSSAVKNRMPLDVGQVVRDGAVGAGVDVLDQVGAGGGAVALPQLDAVRAVVGGEVEHAVDVGQVDEGGAVAAGVDVLDQAVPAVVPSLFHSSRPWLPSLAVK